MAATTTLLGLLTPTQGTLSGTWGDSVNYGISDYVDIAIAGTLSFANDGAITLANTTGSASGNGFNTTTAQYMVIRITGTQSIVKIITGPSYSKLYMVDHAGATSAVTFKAAGQTGVTVAVGEKCFVYYNGTDYVKVASSVVSGVTTIDFGSTGLTPNTATSGAVTVAGTLAPANGGTGVSNNAAMTVTGSGNFAYTRTLTATTNVTFPTTGTLATLAGSETLTNKTLGATTLNGALSCADQVVNRPVLEDYAIQGSAIGSTGATRTFDLAVANFFSATLDQACTFTFSNPPASGDFGCFVLELTNGGAFVITYPASVDFIGGTAPTLTAAGVDQLVFTTRDGGTTYFCFVAGLDIKSP
jgi:hypothetical protein